MNIFEYQDYKTYLRAVLASKPGHGRGFKTRFAEAAGCQIAYISRVLTADVAHFSLEQGERISDHLGHSVEETEYFLLLVQFARAGTQRLKALFQRQVKKQQERHFSLKDRLGVRETLTIEDQMTYYSAWHFTAVHILATIPEYQTHGAISKYLGLPAHKVAEVLKFLTQTGILKEQAGKYSTGLTRIHLAADSPVISKHHTNWRMEAIRSLEREKLGQSHDLHYSSVVSISHEDFVHIKSLLIEAVDRAKKIIRDSREQELCSFCLDFFTYGS